MSRRARICIVSAMHPSLNPRVVKEADALAGAGCAVSLIAPDYAPWARAADEAYRDRPWRRVAAPRFGPHAPAFVRLRELGRRALAHGARRLGDRSSWSLHAALHPAAPDLVRAATRQPADLFIGHYPAGLAAAASAARAQGAPFAFDAEDFHPGDWPATPAHDAARARLHALEAALLPHAAYVSAAAPLIAEAYAARYGIETPATILNVFPLTEAPDAPGARAKPAAARSIYWVSQTLGPERGLETLVDAASLAHSRPRLMLRGAPAPGFAETLLARARAVGVADRLTLLPPAPPRDMARLAADHDLGFVGETGHSANRRVMLTNKQFLYLLAGLPTLLSDIPSHRAFAKQAPGAVALFRSGDAASLARAIDAFLASERALAAASKAAWRLGRERFHWEREETKLLALVERALSRGARGAQPPPTQTASPARPADAPTEIPNAARIAWR